MRLSNYACHTWVIYTPPPTPPIQTSLASSIIKEIKDTIFKCDVIFKDGIPEKRNTGVIILLIEKKLNRSSDKATPSHTSVSNTGFFQGRR